MPAALRWVIVTGEFPPARGGVGDYTAQLAHALAETGDEVHVIAPPGDDGSGEVGSGGVAGGWFAPGASVHRLPDHFGVRSLAALRAILKSIAQPRVLLLQYVPHAFGHRNMNIPFCAWWAAQRDERRAVMFHEVASPIQWRKAVKESVLGTVHRVMGRLLVEGADAIFLSTDAWRPLVQSLGATDLCVRTLPIP
ncbi:MAG TPA: glycosyltransferase, partial [Tepidisphaeraceae bacterium]|nr:glycosyltransferase [Tepidisphaeraceae bacterium]